MWAELPGKSWQPAVVRRVGQFRSERTTVTVAFETGIPTRGTRTPPYLRKRDPAKGGRDRPRPVRRRGF